MNLENVCGLPESEPLWRAERGFVVRDLPWTVEKLRVIPPFEFENWAVIVFAASRTKSKSATWAWTDALWFSFYLLLAGGIMAAVALWKASR